jgi:hypothetical protein
VMSDAEAGRLVGAVTDAVGRLTAEGTVAA